MHVVRKSSLPSEFMNFSDGAPEAAEQPVPKPARPAAHGSHRKHLLLTIVIAGLAVLIGSILYQRKGQ